MLLARLARLFTRPRSLTTRFTRFHAAVLRLSRGRIRRSFLFAGGQPVLSLTTTGRRSGMKRSTAVAYFRDGGAFVLVAMNLGSERDPDWSRNLETNPDATIAVGGRRHEVHARRASGEEAERLWARWAELQRPAESFRRIAGREIPVMVLEPTSNLARSSAAPGDRLQKVEPVESEDENTEAEQPIELPWPLGHYYSPVPDIRKLATGPERSRLWPAQPRATPGVRWREEAQLDLCRNVFARQGPLEFAREPTGDPTEYDESNDMYYPLDALVLQAFLRHLKPARMIEIGSGYSSLVSARVNREFLDGKMHFTCIEPNPRDFLVKGVPGITDLRVREVQRVPLHLFQELEEGDVLFIDTSHTVKTGGDVPWIYNQILPRLKHGVVVHLHDIFLPGEYPEQWVLEGWGWNEIYLVQSFLAFNFGFEILFGVQLMVQNHWDALVEAFPGLTEARAEWGSALWIRRVRRR